MPPRIIARSVTDNSRPAEPEVVVSSRGTIAVPTAPGIGYNLKMDLIEKLTTRTEKLV